MRIYLDSRSKGKTERAFPIESNQVLASEINYLDRTCVPQSNRFRENSHEDACIYMLQQ